MTNFISFPGLGLEFTIWRVALSIGPISIYWYGIIVVTGIILGTLYAMRRGRSFGLSSERVLDVVMYSVVAGIVGARIYYVAFTWDYYKDHLNEIFRVWEGGIAFYGGIIGGVLCACLLCRYWKLPLFRMADACAAGLLLGQGIGRWGNFVNVEAFGDYYTGLFRMVSPHIDTYFHQNPALLPGFSEEEVLAMSEIPVHPTFLYESLWLLLGFVLLALYTKHRRFQGELTLFYLGWNGLGRAVIEGLRTDSLMLGGMRVSQALAILLAAVSLAVWLWAGRLLRSNRIPAWMDLNTPLSCDDTSFTEGTAISKETDEKPPEEIEETLAPLEAEKSEPKQEEQENGTDH